MRTLVTRLRVPGLTFRPVRGEGDFPLVADVFNRSGEADGLDSVATVEWVANRLVPRSDFDPQHDTILAEVNGEPIGFGWVGWHEETGEARVYRFYTAVVAAWRESGVWEAIMDYCEHRLRQIAAGHPPDRPRFLSTHADDRQRAWIERLRRRGYRPVRYFYEMVRNRLEELSPAPLPPGLEVRPVKPEQYRAVWNALTEAFRDHWGFSEPEEEDYQQWLSGPHFAPDLWQVAWDGDQVAGVAINEINGEENQKFNRKRGYVDSLGVQRPWRRRGLGRALLVRSLALLRDRGMTEVALGVDAENPTGALRLYESVGFRSVQRGAIWRKPIEGEGGQ